jgi:cell division protein FtsZ
MPSARAVESRLSELTQQLRANTQRLAERVQRTEPTAVEIPAAPIAEPVAPPAPIAEAAPAPGARPAPLAALEDVTIRPIPPKPTLFIEPTAENAPQEIPAEAAFIPPQAERPGARPRMPRIEDLPLPAQNEIRAKRAAIAEPDKPRPSLLQRLASVGLGRKAEEAAPAPRPQAPRPPLARPHGERLPPYPAPRQDQRPAESRPQELVSEYAKRAQPPRPAPQGLDLHGRPAPVAASIDDDQLEIPAFLRRQAN